MEIIKVIIEDNNGYLIKKFEVPYDNDQYLNSILYQIDLIISLYLKDYEYRHKNKK
ncbi:MAG: hypothetical protein QXW71_01015 [Thermoplasmata archaeon]